MPTNPRPSRKSPKRKFTPRVAGRPAPGQPPVPAGSTPNPADGTPNPADGTQNVADGTQNVADGTQNVADRTQNVADRTPSDEVTTGDKAEEDTAEADTAEADKPKPAAKRPVSRVSTLRPGDSATASSTTSSSTPSHRRVARYGPRTVVGVLAAIAVLLGIFAVIAGVHPGADIGPNKAFIDQPATTELTSQVQSKACALTVNTVDIDKWAGEARAVLTGQALTEFDQYLPQQREILDQTQAVADCRVETVGVADLSGGDDGATARVIVNMIVSQQQAGLAGQSAAPRYQFGMVKQGDAWLINEVEAF
ncbi:hypothetical protein GIY30_03140 [Gordonia sp. HNM0687]|uniref:Mce-associated membrane protein n=1 Tax=Gordonia mangrovi TaxID=2665643 RepID=A0A6L7GKA6_9ACTN|nr:hypothetical protein [Gordonia mangrovi]MXP20350.1 hypothetical protein [Gordonia mangrovi]UVF79049.1 hypothetical protein NWF22_04110 [Gordonia mangrovi]